MLPEAANISLVQLALDGLRANQSAKVAEEAAKKKEEAAAARARAMTKRRADEVPLAKVAQAKAQHILLQVSETQSFEQIDKKLAGWKAILEDAPYHNQEHDFGELAKAHSECPSGARGAHTIIMWPLFRVRCDRYERADPFAIIMFALFSW